ncbi:phage minor capsid protein [Pseudodesulfovibrio senegalensis]|uniref:Minor capsid protein n=1 Tax=Pseudodesulfovibrio senegalensis TaxID=1721087 RepID=A0A6N6N5L7_9BACT|nr:phage minor capsid protein [Pseudodesulfovibrio senegalensis]KAB1443068.1 hypothetical protein F8A88_02045 [Pseudodesulfovibrio senegalensis]
MNKNKAEDIKRLVSLLHLYKAQYETTLRRARQDAKYWTATKQAELMKEVAKLILSMRDEALKVIKATGLAKMEEALETATSELAALDIELGDLDKLLGTLDFKAIKDAQLSVEQFTAQMQEQTRKTLKRDLMTIHQKATENGWSSGKAYRELRDTVMTNTPDFTFTDRAGRKWKPEGYLRMVSRTLMAQAQRESHEAAYTEAGVDLVKVSIHGTKCKKCNPWEGKVLSLTGATKGHATVDDARKAGLFHPNCKHRLLAHVA